MESAAEELKQYITYKFIKNGLSYDDIDKTHGHEFQVQSNEIG